MIKLSVLIPVYNAEETIGLLCDKLVNLLAGKFKLEIILVNDYSTDGSDKICRELHKRYSGIITYIKFSKNFGEHNAVMAGLNHVTGDYCVIMDDDLQNPPEEVIKLVTEIQKGYDVVYTFYDSKKHNIFRNFGSRFNDKVANIILRKPADLYLSSFKIINKFLINEMTKHTCHDPHVDANILITTSNIGKIKTDHMPREHGKSGYTFKKLISLWGNMVVSFSMVPLRLVGILGFVIVVIGVVYGAYKHLDDISHPGGLSEYENLMSVSLILRGLVLLGISIVGEYVGRIYLSMKHNPQFVVREFLSSQKETAGAAYDTHLSDEKKEDKYSVGAD